MNFATFAIIDTLIAIPSIVYCFYWCVYAPRRSKISSMDVFKRVKSAYILAGLTVIYLPISLAYFLYVNGLWMFPYLHYRISFLMCILIAGVLLVNYRSYKTYEWDRFTQLYNPPISD